MTDTTKTEVVKIDFGAISGTTAPSKGAADSALSKVASGGNLKTLSCRSVLDAEQLKTVKEIATAQYPAMLADRTQLSNFGSQSLAGVNACVSRILKEQGKLEIPEVDKITRDMDDAVRGFQRKWDPNSEKVMAKFASIGSFLSGLAGQGRTLLRDLYRDSQEVEKRLDAIAGQLVKRKRQLDINVALCDELYEQNEAAIVQLIGVIAIMEQIRDEVMTHAEQLRQEIDALPAESPDRRTKEEELSNVRELLMDVEIRINEFVQRLYVAWSTSPQVRNIRKISYGLSQRLGLLVEITIPTLKMTIAVWGTLLQAERAGAVTEAINSANNDALTMFANAAAVSVPKVAAITQAPSTRPETIMAIADSIISQNKGIEDAVRQGQTQRAQVVDAIVTASTAINESGVQLNDTVIKLITRAQKPLELPAAPVVPQEVLVH